MLKRSHDRHKLPLNTHAERFTPFSDKDPARQIDCGPDEVSQSFNVHLVLFNPPAEHSLRQNV